MKKKLNLDNLTITSFVTSLEKDATGTVKGGAQAAVTPGCGNSFDKCATVPIEDCYVPSYNPCPTIPVQHCDVTTLFYAPATAGICP
jgi:hypothetical protein